MSVVLNAHATTWEPVSYGFWRRTAGSSQLTKSLRNSGQKARSVTLAIPAIAQTWGLVVVEPA